MYNMLYQYGQVLGEYVDYIVLTQLLFCLLLNIVVIELFVIHYTRYISALCSFC